MPFLSIVGCQRCNAFELPNYDYMWLLYRSAHFHPQEMRPRCRVDTLPAPVACAKVKITMLFQLPRGPVFLQLKFQPENKNKAFINHFLIVPVNLYPHCWNRQHCRLPRFCWICAYHHHALHAKLGEGSFYAIQVPRPLLRDPPTWHLASCLLGS